MQAIAYYWASDHCDVTSHLFCDVANELRRLGYPVFGAIKRIDYLVTS